MQMSEDSLEESLRRAMQFQSMIIGAQHFSWISTNPRIWALRFKGDRDQSEMGIRLSNDIIMSTAVSTLSVSLPHSIFILLYSRRIRAYRMEQNYTFENGFVGYINCFIPMCPIISIKFVYNCKNISNAMLVLIFNHIIFNILFTIIPFRVFETI